MIAVAVLAVAMLLLAGALVLLSQQHERERKAWADERRALVDRVIAGGDVGQVIALDRTRERPRREPVEPPPGRMAGMY